MNQTGQSETPEYLEMLKLDFARRISINPKFSIRRFAIKLNLDSGAMSQILNGTRIPSVHVAKKICEKIGWNPEQSSRFWNSIASIKRSQTPSRWVRKAFKGLPTLEESKNRRDLSLEEFAVIADWYHYAILELTFVKDFGLSPQSISKRLRISVAQAKSAMDRLQTLGMLQSKEGRWTKTNVSVKSASREKTTQAHQRRQIQILDLAKEAIEDVPFEQRNHTAMTMAIDPDRIPEAKKRIDHFIEELCEFLESGKNRTRVYELGVCLFPLDQQIKVKGKI